MSDAIEQQRATITRPLRIVGLATTVTKETAQQRIGALWTAAGKRGLLRPDQPAYSVYFDYEDAYASEYRVLVGRAGEHEPGDDEISLVIPPGAFETFRKRGNVVKVVGEIWHHVWAEWDGAALRVMGLEAGEG